MSDASENIIITFIPTEILLSIFRYLPPTILAKCRLICTRWKQIVDDVFLNDKVWYQYCRSEFPSIYKSAMCKKVVKMTWRQMYRSLFLWSKLDKANETIEEFAFASCLINEICDIRVLSEGLLAVHTLRGILYYDLDTLKLSTKRQTFFGRYIFYAENEDYVAYIDMKRNLSVVEKKVHLKQIKKETSGLEKVIVIKNVQAFLFNESILYYLTYEKEIFTYQLSTNNVQTIFLKKFNPKLVSFGYTDTFNVLTSDRDVYSLIDGTFKLKCNVINNSEVLHILWKYNLLEKMDWGVFRRWIYNFNQPNQHALLNDVLVIYPYGNVFFVGTTCGVFRIYYKPFINGKFDLCNSAPFYLYNFTERYNFPVSSRNQIFQIDVVEMKDAHIVLIAMSKKIVALYFDHVFNQSNSPFVVFQEERDIEI